MGFGEGQNGSFLPNNRWSFVGPWHRLFGRWLPTQGLIENRFTSRFGFGRGGIVTDLSRRLVVFKMVATQIFFGILTPTFWGFMTQFDDSNIFQRG